MTQKIRVPSLALVSGERIPQVGLGTWKSKPGEVTEAVDAALTCGYTHLDCAWFYGNEAEVGAGIKKSGVPREDIFITSKLWNAFHDPADVEEACSDSLSKLGTDYLDLYLIHWPVSVKKGHAMPPEPDEFLDIPLEDTWRALEALVDKRLVRAIGVSNFSIENMQRIFAIAKHPVATNQVEAHVFLQQKKLKNFCEEYGCLITAYAPLGSPDRPPRAFDEADPVLMEDPQLIKIAEKEKRSPASVLIRFAVQRGTVVIPKSVTKARIAENLAAAILPLSDESFQELLSMDRNVRLLKGLMWVPEGTNGPLKKYEDIWGAE